MKGSLAERLRVLRAQEGLTLNEASAKIGVNRHTLRDLELGKREPYGPTIRKIAEAYNVSLAQLLEEPALAGKVEDGPSLEELHATARCATNWLVMPEAEWRAAWSPDLSPREAMSIVHEMTAEISALKPLMDKQERGLPWSRRMFSGHFGKAWWRYFDGLERAKARGEAAGLIGPEGTPKDLAKMLGQEPGKSLDELMLAAS